MYEKFLKEVISMTLGKQWEKIAELLDTKKYTNEFDIAKKLEITINQARNLLYKLADSGVVSSIRKKDKKKGWYTYFWKIELLKSLELLKSSLETRVNQINNQINNREANQFYICERCAIELTEENALSYQFTCPECGEVFKIKDNSKLLKELKKNQIKFSEDISEINKEIDDEKGKNMKVRVREIEREKKKKSDDRKKSIKMRSEERRLSASKEIKKKPTKKVVNKKVAKKVSVKKSKKAVKKTKL